MNKKFTILTATYNSERYFKEWAESILLQSYRPLEVVCVDDKSEDNTPSFLEKVKPEFDRNDIEFKFIISKKKLHCGSSYNLALKKATGSLFGILDADDMLEPFACNFIADIYEQCQDIAWIYTQYNKYNRTMTRIIKKGFCRHPGKKETLLSMEEKNRNVYGHWRTFSDRISTFKNLFGDHLKCCVDKNLGFRLEESGNGMFVDKICYKYRTRNKSENPIVHRYPLKRIRKRVVDDAHKRRRKGKVYPIVEYRI